MSETIVEYGIGDLEAGMSASISRVVSADDLTTFADLTGDDNPVHLNEAYAKTTMFKGRIAHGMLSAGLISAVLGTRLPGPGSIYLSQSLKFRAPVRIGDEVTATATIFDIDHARRRVTLSCTCHVGELLVLDGEALMMLPVAEPEVA